jgi:hypothetical protein
VQPRDDDGGDFKLAPSCRFPLVLQAAVGQPVVSHRLPMTA